MHLSRPYVTLKYSSSSRHLVQVRHISPYESLTQTHSHHVVQLIPITEHCARNINSRTSNFFAYVGIVPSVKVDAWVREGQRQWICFHPCSIHTNDSYIMQDYMWDWGLITMNGVRFIERILYRTENTRSVWDWQIRMSVRSDSKSCFAYMGMPIAFHSACICNSSLDSLGAWII